MGVDSYNQLLYEQCDPEKITELSKVVFVEGHLEKLDDLLLVLLPLANVVYYKYIRYLDDREYAKEDLISDAILRLYQDMSLRWDKYIHIDSYYDYYRTILRNGMIGLVHEYHNYYSVDEYDPDTIKVDEVTDDIYDNIDMKILKENVNSEIIELSKRILKCRTVNTNLLLTILKYKYIDLINLESLRSRVRVLGISNSLFDFYVEHVDYTYKLAYNYQYALLGGKLQMISRISDTIDRFEDVTYKMLATNYYESIVPEIYAEFGAAFTKKFIRIFSNRSIRVPEYREFCDNLLGGVVLTLARGSKDNLYRVAEEYNMPYKSLARIYNKAVKYES